MISTPKAKRDLFLATSLCDGLEDSNIKQITTLLSKHADPNILIPTHGITPFHLVIGNNSEAFAEEITKLFLCHGGNPNVRSSDGTTPVHIAAAWGRVGILELLLANGGDPLALDDDGCSPFHYAFNGKYFNVITLLGKHCGNFMDDNDTPKYKIALDKVLINNGDVMAEYIVTDNKNDSGNTSNKCSRSPIKIGKTSPTKYDRNFDKKTTFSNYITSPLNIVRKMKIENSHSTTELTGRLEKLRFEGNYETQNISGKRITDDVLASFASTSDSITEPSFTSNDTSYAEEFLNLPSRSASKKKYKKYTPKVKLMPQCNLDTSILSKSPNCNLPLSSKRKQELLRISDSHTSQNFQNVHKQIAMTPCRIKDNNTLKRNIKKQNVQSTPRRRQDSYVKRRNVRDLDSSFELNRSKDETDEKIFHIKKENFSSKGFLKNSLRSACRRVVLSPDVEDSSSTKDRRYNGRNIAMKLHEGKYDDDIDETTYDSSDYSKLTPSTLDFSSSFETDTRNNDLHIELPKYKNDIKTETSTSYTDNNNYDEKFVNRSSRHLKINNKTEYRVPKIEQSEYNININDMAKSTTFVTRSENLFLDCIKLKSKDETHDSMMVRVSRNLSEDTEEQSTDTDTSKYTLDKCVLRTSSCEKEESSIDLNNDRDMKKSPSKNFDTYNLEKERVPSEGSSYMSCVSVQEEYKYEDLEKGIVFLERRLCITPSFAEIENCFDRTAGKNNGSQSMTSQTSSLSNIPNELLLLDDHVLRKKLIELGNKPGPITSSTRHVYLKRLVRLERSIKHNRVSPRNNHKSNLNTIKSSLLFGDWIKDLNDYRTLEENTFREFAVPDPSRRWREGTAKTSFNYLLLDSRITRDLPRRNDLEESEKWSIFLSAIFYIGKGKRSRPYSHLYDAFNAWVSKQSDISVRKIKRILDIWNDGYGVVCLHVFQNTIPVEAYAREAAMIDALGMEHLANSQSGQYYGIIATWCSKEKFNFGRYLLYRAMQIFMHEGERQLFPEHL